MAYYKNTDGAQMPSGPAPDNEDRDYNKPPPPPRSPQMPRSSGPSTFNQTNEGPTKSKPVTEQEATLGKDASKGGNSGWANTETTWAPTASTQSSVDTTAPRDAGTGFVNWDQYYNANAGQIQASANQYMNQAAQAAQKTQHDIDQGVHSTEASQYAASGPYYTDVSSDAQADANRAEMARLSNWSAPGSLLDTQYGQGLFNEAAQADAQLAALKNSEGVQALLSQNGPALGTQGNALDSALVNQSVQPRYADLLKKYGSLSDSLNKATAYTSGIGAESVADKNQRLVVMQRALDAWAKKKADSAKNTHPEIDEIPADTEKHWTLTSKG